MQELHAEETMRKIQQLKPYFDPTTRTRSLHIEQVKETDLAGHLISADTITEDKLIPFLLKAIQVLDERVRALERR